MSYLQLAYVHYEFFKDRPRDRDPMGLTEELEHRYDQGLLLDLSGGDLG